MFVATSNTKEKCWPHLGLNKKTPTLTSLRKRCCLCFIFDLVSNYLQWDHRIQLPTLFIPLKCEQIYNYEKRVISENKNS